MEIKIGIQHVSRELVFETDQSADAVAAAVGAATESGTLDLTDTKGRRFVVPSAHIAFVEMGKEEKQRVGFGA